MRDSESNVSLIPAGQSAALTALATNPVENAIVLWAEATTHPETRDREERLRDKQQIIRSFLNFGGKHPGGVDPMDVRAWRKHLESKKSENMVYSYLSASHPSMSGSGNILVSKSTFSATRSHWDALRRRGPIRPRRPRPGPTMR